MRSFTCKRFLDKGSILSIFFVGDVYKNALLSFFRALCQADVIFLFGARLNWILDFGKPPTFKADVKIIQVGCSQFGYPQYFLFFSAYFLLQM